MLTLKNNHGYQVTLLETGGAIQSILMPDREGKLGDIVLGFDDPADYPGRGSIGAFVGRYANRIGGGSFRLNGRTYQVKAGTQVKLTPGESISIQPLMYHDFEVEKGTGAVLLGEVSQVNDDNTDNRFNPPVGRFPEIEEDEAPYRLLCNEYPKAD